MGSMKLETWWNQVLSGSRFLRGGGEGFLRRTLCLSFWLIFRILMEIFYFNSIISVAIFLKVQGKCKVDSWKWDKFQFWFWNPFRNSDLVLVQCLWTGTRAGGCSQCCEYIFFLLSSVKTGGSGSGFFFVICTRAHIFLLESAQELDIGTSLLLNPDPKLKMRSSLESCSSPICFCLSAKKKDVTNWLFKSVPWIV
jgi:hypothetical protein